MGTRADFYIGIDENAEWLGSTAWDGNPGGIDLTLLEKDVMVIPGLKTMEFPQHADFPEGQHLFDSKTPEEFRQRVSQYFENRDDATRPEDGWPWPWDDSSTTDYAYAFDPIWGGVVVSCFGSIYMPVRQYMDKEDDDDDSKGQVFPNMEERKNVQLGGNRSGLIVIGENGIE